MKLHNSLEIKKGGKVVYTELNSVVRGAGNYIKNFVFYNNYIVFGRSLSNTTSLEKTMHNVVLSLKSDTESCNFDPKLGQVYVTKRAVVKNLTDESISFSEVAISNEGLVEGLTFCTIANRFLLKNEQGEAEAFVVNPGEQVAVEITIYAELLNEFSNMNLCGGVNPFCAMLLGVDETGGAQDIALGLAFGDNSASTSAVIDSRETIKTNISSEVAIEFDETSGVVKFALSGNTGAGEVKELFVTFAGVPVFRINNFDVSETTQDVAQGLVANSCRLVELTEPNIVSVDRAIDVDDWHTTFRVRRFSKSMSKMYSRPFGDFDYNNLDVKYYSVEGDIVVFPVDGRLDAYVIENSEFVKVDTTGISGLNIEHMVIVRKMMLVRYIRSATRRKTLCYRLVGHKFKEVNIDVEFNINDVFTDWGFNSYFYQNQFGFIGCNKSGTLVCMLMYREASNSLISGRCRYYDLLLDKVEATEGYNTFDLTYYGYKLEGEGAGGYVIYAPDFIPEKVESKPLEIIFKNCKEKRNRKTGNGVLCAFYNDAEDKRPILAWYIHENSSKARFIAYTTACHKIFLSQNGRVMTVLNKTGMQLINHVDGNFKMNKFANPVLDGISDNLTVKELAFLDGMLLVYYNDTNAKMNYYRLYDDKFEVGPLTPGTAYNITYTKAVLPGSNGEKTINVNIECRV